MSVNGQINPNAMIHKLLEENEGQIKKAIVNIELEDGRIVTYSSHHDSAFMAQIALLLQDYSLSILLGDE